MYASRIIPVLLLLAALTPLGWVSGARASSHREAPFLTEHPKLDATDFYMFRSYETGKEDTLTLIANYLPMQDGAGGPNFYTLDPEALYEIHIENTGDAREDLTFQFRFTHTLRNLTVSVDGVDVSVPLIATGPITAADTSTLNVLETYTLTLVRGGRRSGNGEAVQNASAGGTTFTKPVDYLGTKTLGSAAAYEVYATSYLATLTIPGCGSPGRVFVGQRADPFAADLGALFDLVNTDPSTPTDPPLDRNTGGTNRLADKNVTSLALELPISCLTNGGANPVLGAWTTASLRQGRALNPSPRYDADPTQHRDAAREGGAWTQVSRLGNPLVNEVLIGLKDKDRFNASEPSGDEQFRTYFQRPSLPALLNLLFSVSVPTRSPRDDLEQVFLTGVPGLNPTSATAEFLRLDTGVAAIPAATQQDLGVLAGDNAGFPNGRRPGDDVVDIALRVLMGALLPAAEAPSGSLGYTDGASAPATTFQSVFPYLNTPHPGAP